MQKVKASRRLWITLIMGLLLFGLSTDALAGPLLKMAFVEADSPVLAKKLARMGIDIAAVRKIETPGQPVRWRIEVVVTENDQQKLEREGLRWHLVAEREMSRSLQMRAAAQSVYHSFDEPGTGIRDQLVEIAAAYPKICKLENIGASHENRPMLALRLTGKGKGAGWMGGSQKKEEVLFLATHHAREWVATEMAMRLIRYLTQGYGTDERVTRLLNTTHVWIIPVANPDGYQYTFDHERLWRKNLRDNDGDGQITVADGVDLNRNFDSHWGLDDEGSSPVWSDMTYRGPAPNSEPENQAIIDFIGRHDFKFALSYHTYSNLILYPWGWQVKTPSFDNPIFVAQAGTDEKPAIWDSLLDKGYDPGVAADLYITNGDFTDWTYAMAEIPSYTVELTLGVDAEGNYYGFEFPDDEAMVQTVFEDNLEFALCLAESAATPQHPKSPVGLEVQTAYHDPLTSSHGTRQMIDLLAPNKTKGPLWLFSTINKKRLSWSWFRPMRGESYNDQPGVYFSGYQAGIDHQQAGDEVTYWILGHKLFLGPFTYTVAQASGNPVLILSAEDYTGKYPEYPDPSGPNYLSYYTEALEAAGRGYDVWDVTAQNGAPPFREVLSNYRTVIWYTGDDYAATVPGTGVHEEIAMGIRDFMNYTGGSLLASGQGLIAPAVSYGLLSDDFFQYTLGAYLTVDGGGLDPVGGEAYAVRGEDGDPVFDGLSFELSGVESADNQVSPDTFLATSYFLPHFDNAVAARYERPGGPFDPHGGSFYMYSQMSDQAYKRLGRTLELPAGNPQLSFWISFDIEPEWDYAFVEVNEVGSDNWTTLPDLNGLTVQSTGQSCAQGWVQQIHPHLAHYMDEACNPSGTTGEWHALTGNSGGWRQMVFDLSAYAGKTVEIYISYASDWGTQGLGIFVDDIVVTGYDAEGFEESLGDFVVGAPPQNNPFNNWIRMESGGFAEGPVIRTPKTVFMGFGFEAIAGAQTRATLMGRLLDYLLFDE